MEVALEEIVSLDRALSLFRRDSYLSFVNRNAGKGPVPVPQDLFELLSICSKVSEASRGAFDITVGPLMERFGFRGGPDGPAESRPKSGEGETGGTGMAPGAGKGAAARSAVGYENLLLGEKNRSVRFAAPGMSLDLGGVAKGYALDRAAEILRENGVESALVHGGTSTVVGIGPGPGPGAGGWKIGVRRPSGPGEAGGGSGDGLLAVARLRDTALAVSAPHGRFLEREGRMVGHLMDPAAAAPASGVLAAAVIARNATLADAWSTAFAAAGPSRFHELIRRAEGVLAALILPAQERGMGPRPRGTDPGEAGGSPGAVETGDPSRAPKPLVAGPRKEAFVLLDEEGLKEQGIDNTASRE